MTSETEFQIFYDVGEGAEPQQLESVHGFENARAVMERFAAQMPGRYLIFDPSEGEIIAQIDSCRSPKCKTAKQSAPFRPRGRE